ncbi:hypothetical protein [Kineococcus glutinatus]|uniref:BRCT domain-containing protein n=1 Tax=Kineococcus glutinatus TaxID=1070872 RepID=A0ABP8VKW6_9ACTN
MIDASAAPRWTHGAPLLPGTRVVLGGPLLTPRAELAGRARSAGLVPVEEVDGTTGLLVAADAASGEAEVRAAMRLGVPIVDEYTFEDLLPAVPRPRG